MDYVSHTGEKRMVKPFGKLALAAILAGMFIAFGSVGNILVSADLYKMNAGVAKFIGASEYPVG